jgi:hypothetical protein
MEKDITLLPTSLALDVLVESKLYSEKLGINLPSKKDNEIFKWFLASILFGAPISETIAMKTYKTFEKYDLLDSKKIIEAGQMFLVNPIMREGGYVKYDEKTSFQLLKNCRMLIENYNGSLNLLQERSISSSDLEQKIEGFFGIGPVTSNIFLRELRPFWHNSDPEPLPMVKELAKLHNINLEDYDRKSIKFIRIESGLIQLRKELK